MIEAIKNKIFNSKIQVIHLSPEGVVLESDNTLFSLQMNEEITTLHPFFEGIAPLFSTLEEKIKFPCVNLNVASKEIIVDIDLFIEGGKLFLVIFDFTAHYLDSHPLVQEKNEASIQKNKLTFERNLLLAKESFKNTFLAHLNHEIRNPLNNMIGFIDLLKISKLNYDQKEILKLLDITGNHLSLMMDDLLDISKIEKGLLKIKSVPFSLTSVLNNLIKIFELKYAKTGVHLSLDVHQKTPIRLLGDPVRLNQILFNLLENAFKKTVNGEISVVVSLKERDELTKRVRIDFKVTDTGIGISEKNITRVFDSYYQIELNNEKPLGEGLGLKIVKELTSLLEGNITVASKENVGTSFHLNLPFFERDIEKKKRKTVRKGTGIIKGVRILIVENDPVNQLLLMKIFIDKGNFKIDLAKDGKQAIALLASRKYDLALLKTKIPDFSGIEIIKHIRTHKEDALKSLPILMVSGSTLKTEQEEILAVGASAFLAKPYTKKELFKTIDVLLEN